MNTMKALFVFDFSRCRGWLIAWWLCCLAFAASGVGLVISGEMLFEGNGGGITLSATYLVFLILVGLIFNPAHPGRTKSFFRARPVVPGRVLFSRWCFAGLFLLLPFFLSQLLPLLLVDQSFAAVSAFAVHYWGVHLGAVAILGALASASKKISSYLLRSLFGGAALLAVAGFMRRFSWRDSNWFYVASPEAGRLLWELVLCLLGMLVFIAITGALYRARGSWRLIVVGILAALALAAAWKPVKFLTDVSKVGQAVADGVVNLETVRFKANRLGGNSSYTVQRNRGYTETSTYVQSAPPYWNSDAEEFWFIPGVFEIEGLDSSLSHSARLVEARWISEEGEVVPYDPPSGTHIIRTLGYTKPPPPVATARMVELLGEPPSRPEYFRPFTGKKTDLLLFGAWTSVYERFKTTPGRLELRVRIDFYQHVLSQRVPLGSVNSDGLDNDAFSLQELSINGGELEAKLLYFVPTYRWSVPIDQLWGQGQRNWWIHDPATGQRAPAMGMNSGGIAMLQSLRQRSLEPSFREDGTRWHLPDISQPESLELLHIAPRYLGTAEVEVTTEGFALVTPESIEMAERDERIER